MLNDVLLPYSESLHLPHHGILAKIDFINNFIDMSSITISKLFKNKDWGPLPDEIYPDDFAKFAGHPFLYNWKIKPSVLIESYAFAPGVKHIGKTATKKILSKAGAYLDGVVRTVAFESVLNKLSDSIVDLPFVGNNKFWYLSSWLLTRELYFPYFNDDDSFDSFKRVRSMKQALEIDPSFQYWRYQ